MGPKLRILGDRYDDIYATPRGYLTSPADVSGYWGCDCSTSRR